MKRITVWESLGVAPGQCVPYLDNENHEWANSYDQLPFTIELNPAFVGIAEIKTAHFQIRPSENIWVSHKTNEVRDVVRLILLDGRCLIATLDEWGTFLARSEP